MDLASLQQQLASQGGTLPPVDKWNPAFCGDIDLVIKRDGSWHYMGSPIGRQALVKLFASVLKREEDQYFLVTPVEKVGIVVEDAPFIITEWHAEDDLLVFTTNIGDKFVVSEQHPVSLLHSTPDSQPLPYVLVRRNLLARLHQNVFYQLVERGTETQENGVSVLQVASGDYTFSLGYL